MTSVFKRIIIEMHKLVSMNYRKKDEEVSPIYAMEIDGTRLFGEHMA